MTAYMTKITESATCRKVENKYLPVERGHAARLAAEMKVGKYGDHFPDDTFVPLAVETLIRVP
jgi:hypothetical protein